MSLELVRVLPDIVEPPCPLSEFPGQTRFVGEVARPFRNIPQMVTQELSLSDLVLPTCVKPSQGVVHSLQGGWFIVH